MPFYMENNKNYYSIDSYLKETFNKKMIKLSIDGGFTCPNRDGSKGTGGCAFCSENGSGEFASNIDEQINLYKNKWPNAGHLAYFQNYTNTYAPANELRQKYYAALNHPEIEGLVISTRPDCLPDETQELLSEINSKYFMWVELGLQTINDDIRNNLNVEYTLEDFENAFEKLSTLGIKTVVHLILGLPGETEEDMFNSVEYIANIHPFGLKLHMLNLVKGSKLYEMMPEYCSFDSIEQYCDLIVRLLEIIPQDITIHRLNGDVKRSILVLPEWSYKKRTILNTINKMLKERETYQGRLAK